MKTHWEDGWLPSSKNLHQKPTLLDFNLGFSSLQNRKQTNCCVVTQSTVFCYCNPSRLIDRPSSCEQLCSVFLLRLLLWGFFLPFKLLYDVYPSVFFPLLFLISALLEAKPSSSWSIGTSLLRLMQRRSYKAQFPSWPTSSSMHPVAQKWCSEFLSSLLHDPFFNMLEVFSPLCPDKRLVFSSDHCTYHLLPCDDQWTAVSLLACRLRVGAPGPQPLSGSHTGELLPKCPHQHFPVSYDGLDFKMTLKVI